MRRRSHTVAYKLASTVIAAVLATSTLTTGVSAWAEEGTSDHIQQSDELVQVDADASPDDVDPANADVLGDETLQPDFGEELPAEPDQYGDIVSSEAEGIPTESDPAEEFAEQLVDTTELNADAPEELEAMATSESAAYLSALNSYISKYGSPRRNRITLPGPNGGFEHIAYVDGLCVAHPIDYDGDGQEDEMFVCYSVPGRGAYCQRQFYVEIWQYRSSSSSSTQYGNAITYGNGKVSIVEKTEAKTLDQGWRESEAGCAVANLIEKNGRHFIDRSHASGAYNIARYWLVQYDDGVDVDSYMYKTMNQCFTLVMNAAGRKAYGVDACMNITNETLALLRQGRMGVVFADVSGSTSHIEDIRWLASMGISTGWVEPGGLRTFRGMDTVKRQDMAAFLFRLARARGLVSDSWQPTASQRRAFSDVTSSTPHAREIWWLASAGITTGYPDGTFRGMDTVKRQDMAAFLFRLAKRMGRGGASDWWQPTSSQRSRFNDVTASTPHAREVWWLAAKGVSTGYSDRTFRGGDPVYRQDMAAFLHRLYSL